MLFSLFKIKNLILYRAFKVHAAHASFHYSKLATSDASATYGLTLHRCFKLFCLSLTKLNLVTTALSFLSQATKFFTFPFLLMLRLIYFWLIIILMIDDMMSSYCNTTNYSSLRGQFPSTVVSLLYYKRTFCLLISTYPNVVIFYAATCQIMLVCDKNKKQWYSSTYLTL